jgi:hypothetical protein
MVDRRQRERERERKRDWTGYIPKDMHPVTYFL